MIQSRNLVQTLHPSLVQQSHLRLLFPCSKYQRLRTELGSQRPLGCPPLNHLLRQPALFLKLQTAPLCQEASPKPRSQSRKLYGPPHPLIRADLSQKASSFRTWELWGPSLWSFVARLCQASSFSWPTPWFVPLRSLCTRVGRQWRYSFIRSCGLCSVPAGRCAGWNLNRKW